MEQRNGGWLLMGTVLGPVNKAGEAAKLPGRTLGKIYN